MYTFATVCLGQERTVNPRIIINIFIYSTNSQWVASNLEDTVLGADDTKRNQSQTLSVGSPSHLHQGSRDDIDHYGTVCDRCPCGPGTGSMEAEDSTSQSDVCVSLLSGQWGKEKRKSLTWERRLLKTPFPGSRPSDLAIHPLLSFRKQIWQRQLGGKYGEAVGKTLWECLDPTSFPKPTFPFHCPLELLGRIKAFNN